uniref:Salivary lipocalin n=1 Tax=Triatoma infestans TaxID=30076 RepID=A6YPM1_TRIIF|nr:salivary lipocalin [Triatoma infestans]
MKTFITVIFFGILTYTDAKKPVETCKNTLPIKQGLNIPSFFNGAWFTTHMMEASSTATCRAYQFEVTQRGIALTYEGQFTVSGNTKEYTVTCSSKTEAGKPLNPSAPILFKCVQQYRTVYHTQGNEFFDLYMVVIETDYQNYAFVYRCMKYDAEKDSNGMYMILQRTKTGDVSKAKDILKKSGLDFGKFRQMKC